MQWRALLWSLVVVVAAGCAGGADPGVVVPDQAADADLVERGDVGAPAADLFEELPAGDLPAADLPPELPVGDVYGDLPYIAGEDALLPGCEPGEGCFLDPCAESGDCLSGWCIEHLGEDVCTNTCECFTYPYIKL